MSTKVKKVISKIVWGKFSSHKLRIYVMPEFLQLLACNRLGDQHGIPFQNSVGFAKNVVISPKLEYCGVQNRCFVTTIVAERRCCHEAV